jgi:hypothetical protein
VIQTHNKVADDFAVLAKALPARDYWMVQLKEVASLKPPEVTLQRLDFGPTGYCQILGYSDTERSAADFTSALRGYFATLENPPKMQPTLDDRVTGRRNVGGRQVYVFQINFELADKQNTLKVTPTPAPVQDGRMGPGMRGPAVPGRRG